MDAIEDARSKDSPVTPVKMFISIDEAHVMTGKLRYFPRARTVYQNLSTVLAWLKALPVFTIFLSTKSQLQELTALVAKQSFFRVENGTLFFPPFTELSFDTFATGLYTSLKEQSPNGSVSLNSVCSLDVIARFGRPLSVSCLKLFCTTHRVSFQVVFSL